MMSHRRSYSNKKSLEFLIISSFFSFFPHFSLHVCVICSVFLAHRLYSVCICVRFPPVISGPSPIIHYWIHYYLRGFRSIDTHWWKYIYRKENKKDYVVVLFLMACSGHNLNASLAVLDRHTHTSWMTSEKKKCTCWWLDDWQPILFDPFVGRRVKAYTNM